ncbi:MAG TPA: ABC transporter permease [Solirubrobacterales bacterium]|nr:ABC transporter permease [Solirubrobacterales bacterium]
MSAAPDPLVPGPQPIGEGAPIPAPTSEVGVEQRYPLRGAAFGQAVRGRIGANASLISGLIIVGLLMAVAILAGVLSPHDPVKQEIDNTLAPPGAAGHLLDTDQLGRDVLSRLLHGARTDIFVALGALVCPFLIGTFVGIWAGYRGGWFDSVVVGIIDVIIAFPILVLLIALVFVLGPGIATIVIAVTAIDWVVYARLARTSSRRERAMEYVMAARVGGIPTYRILARHVLPNIIAQSVVYAMSDAVLIILFITTLGFLGLGVPPPAPDWGTMIAEAQPYFNTQWWLAVIPGLAIILTGLGLSLIADGLAQKLDAR